MVQQVTQGIKISVKTKHEGPFLQNQTLKQAFSYTITIENKSKDTVQLISRRWKIKDSLYDKIVVKGNGVIGKKPILSPGEKHTYTSGCLLHSSIGAMKGHFDMVNLTTNKAFKVPIPLFNLSAPFSIN